MLKLRELLYQNESYLITTKACTLTLDLVHDYDEDDNYVINESEGYIWVKSLIGKIKFEDFQFDIILDYPVNIFIEKYKIIKKKEIILEYSADSNILEITIESQNFKQQALYLERLLGGKELFKDSTHLLLKLFNIFKNVGMDMVHLEIILSNVLRDENNLSNPARLSKIYNPTLINIKDIVFRQNSMMSSLSFENINKAISTGLITDDTMLEPTILEKVLLNKIVEVEKKK